MKKIRLLFLVYTASVIAVSAQQPSASPRPDNQPSAVESQAVCVVGNVAKPSLLPIEGGMRLTEAINKAGGALPDSKSTGVKVYRSFPGSDQKEMITIKELRAVERGRTKDIELQAGDIVEVMPRDTRKAVPQARVIPCPAKTPVVIL